MEPEIYVRKRNLDLMWENCNWGSIKENEIWNQCEKMNPGAGDRKWYKGPIKDNVK